MIRKKMYHILILILQGMSLQTGHAETLMAQWDLAIRGTVMASSCVVTNSDMTQPLGEWETKDLKTVGMTTTPVDIHILLSGCDDGITGTTVTLTGISDLNDSTLLGLSNAGMDGTATGVGVQITDSSGDIVPVNNGSLTLPLVAGDNDILLHAAYKVTVTPVTGGKANAVMYMDFVYQ